MQKQTNISNTKTLANTQNISSSVWKDLIVLTKFKLSFTVVLSSALAYLVVAGANIQFDILALLSLGGILITCASNALNQVLEREYDAQMERTATRPLVTETISVSSAVLMSGLMAVTGILLLAAINPLVAMLGTISLMLYAFVYTPLKRYSTISVAIGAIPGALPVLIGAVAFDGNITLLGLFLFAVQFFWQFPHFWAIGYRSFADYRKAGFELVPYNESTGMVDSRIGKSSLLYSIFLLGIIIMAFYVGLISGLAFILSFALSLGYTYYCIRFTMDLNKKTATQLMIYSFFYIPVILITYIIL